jgi:hypothetical protein
MTIFKKKFKVKIKLFKKNQIRLIYFNGNWKISPKNMRNNSYNKWNHSKKKYKRKILLFKTNNLKLASNK